jgi:hypothetical protein
LLKGGPQGIPHQSTRVCKKIGMIIDVMISVVTGFMIRNQGNVIMEKGVCFIQKENWRGKNELKKNIKEMMYATQKNRCVES